MKEKSLQVLLVEDNAGDARLIREMFTTEQHGKIELTHLLRMTDALTHLAKGGVDVVLLDMGLPDAHGLDTVRRAHAVAPNVPLIVITGLDDEALAAEAMKEGAQDYLIKGQIENRALPRALRHAIERHRMQAETDLIRTNQLQYKDEFLSHVSHELRSPLTAVYGFVTILLDGLAGELNPEQREYLEDVLRNTKQLKSMINDLLEVTHFQEGKVLIESQCISVSDAIDYAVSTLQEVATTKGIVLSSDTDSRLPPVCADPTRLRQILIILVENAIKFTPANGVVKIQARMFEKDSKFLVLEVSDSGCGIPPDMTERIFERLYQAADSSLPSRKGLGLGLHICKELVTRQGGEIWANSSPGQGSAFSFTLPIFSLLSLIAPGLRRGRLTDHPVTLVVVEIGSQTGWLSDEARAKHSQGVRDLVRRCLNCELDVLLPNMGLAGAAEIFFVVTFTDTIGGEAITKRIREQFEESGYFQQAGIILSTFYRSLGPIKRDAIESTQDYLNKVATKIQELMNEETSSRMVENGK
jgi:signal transduction histidine kinase